MARIIRGGWPLLAVVALTGGCGESETARAARADVAKTGETTAEAALVERQVTAVMIGRQIGAGNRITEPTFEFAPQDVVHISVATEGTEGPGTLTAAWRSQGGEILQQSSEPVRPEGENTAFQLSQPKGFKPGTYKVVLFLGEDSVDTKVFVVKK